MNILRSSLPAFTFFVLLGAAAGAGYWLGASRIQVDARIFTCSMHPQVKKQGEGLCPICHMQLTPRSAENHADEAVISIDPIVVQNMGVRVQSVTEGELTRELNWLGTLKVAQTQVRDVTIKFAAVVERLHANRDGMTVQQGEPIFELYAPDLIVALEQLLAATRENDAVTSAAMRLRLLRWDMTDAQIDAQIAGGRVARTIAWPCPVSGVVMQRNIVQGGPIEAGTSVLRLADLSMLWLDSQVPHADLLAVAKGTTVQVTLQGSTEVFSATVLEVLPTLDEQLRTGTVRCEISNPDRHLRIGQFAKVRLRSVLAQKTLLIPSDAVLDTGLRQVAYVALGNGRFEPRELQLGQYGNQNMVAVKRGLVLAEQVVVSGQFLIDAESRMQASVRKLSSDGTLPATAVKGQAMSGESMTLTETDRALVDAVFTSYLAVATMLANDRAAAEQWSALQRAARALDSLPSGLKNTVLMLQASLTTAPPDLKDQRQALKAVSAATIDLFSAARPSKSFGENLFVMYCSMVEARWLQTEPKVHNPYYGAEMLQCGEVKQTYPLYAEARR
jgi:hypothetical protein